MVTCASTYEPPSDQDLAATLELMLAASKGLVQQQDNIAALSLLQQAQQVLDKISSLQKRQRFCHLCFHEVPLLCSLLCHVTLNTPILYHTITVPYRTLAYHTVTYHTMLSGKVAHCTCRSTPHHTTPHHATPHHTTLHHTAPQHRVR